ncbi:MAG: DnaB-like helicase C-terminal domain-containing protein [Gemmatimonadaceae bacterium]
MTNPSDSLVSKLVQRMDAVSDGGLVHDTVPTGFPSIDKLLGGGLRRGDLVVLGGDVGAGKSALALAIALRIVGGGRRALVLSSEMSAERIAERALAIEGRAPIDDLRAGKVTDEARAALGVAALRLRDAMPTIARLVPTGAAGIIEGILASKAVDVVVIDSLQGAPAGAAAQDEEIAACLRALKAAAVEHDVTILVVSHLPSLARDRADPRPALDDFGALGAVKQHADVVLGLFREEMYNRERSNDGATELAILKNRNGATAYVDLYFYKQWLRFEDMIEPDR